MGLLQSLGLAGAFKDLRRLLHRPSRSSKAPADSATSLTESQDAPAHTADTSTNPGSVAPSQAESTQVKNANELITQQHQDGSVMLKSSNGAVVKPPGNSAVPVDKQKCYEVIDAKKENQRPKVDTLADDLADINIGASSSDGLRESAVLGSKEIDNPDDPAVQAEKELHQRFTEEALDMVSLHPGREFYGVPFKATCKDLQTQYRNLKSDAASDSMA